MGLAKAAELNHYPGPAHVLTLATELALTPDQKARTDAYEGRKVRFQAAVEKMAAAANAP